MSETPNCALRACDAIPSSSPVGGSGHGWRVADEPFRDPPFVFEQKDASKLRKPIGAVFKGAEDCFPVGDRERDEFAVVLVGVLKGFGCVVEPFRAEALGEFEHETVRNQEASEEHLLDSSRFRTGA